jgi:hypothetical protein
VTLRPQPLIRSKWFDFPPTATRQKSVHCLKNLRKNQLVEIKCAL